ncbi:MAG: hypothetical protein SPI30_00585 [Prevotella sp.]|nr:hypothetical protein [Prevotella sp.]
MIFASFHPHEACGGNGTERSCYRTNGWYSCYQTLVRPVPVVGTVCTNDWYQFHTTTIS